MTDYNVLDLFCGLGGFSQAFDDSERWTVTTVDIEARFDPDICADVMDRRPSDFDQEFDVVLASPPCTQFSIAASSLERIVDGEPQTDDARDAVTLAHHTVGLVQGLSPSYWVLENPRGYLRQFLGDPTATVTYCQYGESYMKPTDLWGHHPPMTYRRCQTGQSCHADNTDGDHGGRGNCDVMDDGKSRTAFQQVTSGTKSAERAKVPYQLSASIRDACERALDGDVAEQVELSEVVA